MSKVTTKQSTMRDAELVTQCSTFSVDLAKSVFQVAGEDSAGRMHYEARLRSREAFATFLRALPKGVEVLMETGPGAQAWAREAQSLGLRVRLLPPQRVAEHRSGAKNDRRDAHALLRAGRDTSIFAVPVKSAETLALQALHRVRSGYIRRRTAIGNQVRGLLMEQGIAMPKGDTALAQRAGRVIEDASQPVPYELRELVADLLAEWNNLGQRIEAQSARLTRMAQAHEVARRLMTVRGIGPISASAVVVKERDPNRFPNARQFAAYFGAVPNQHSSGERIRLGKMSKRGDGYVRSLFIQGAQAVLQQVRPDSTAPDDQRLLRWLQRHGRKGAAVRLANRNLRIAWVLLQDEGTYRREPRARSEDAMTA